MADNSGNGVECSKPKKVKLDAENTSENDDSIHEVLKNLSSFEIKRILNNNNLKKCICIEGTFEGHDSSAVVVLEKKTFCEDELKTELFNETTLLRKLYRNDIYGSYECFPSIEYNGMNVTVIHPATQKHIKKFERKELHIVQETPELYNKVVLPYLEKEQFSLEWVDNILEHKAEVERIVHEDKDKNNGFIMVPDLKWDGKPTSLQLLALPFQRLKSIRDLNKSHLPLLKNIRDAGIAVIFTKYKIPASQLRIYFHYQPSYYHLHVHFSYLMHESAGIFTEKAHLLSTVINNIELMPDYYSKATLSFVVQKDDPLFIKFQEHGVLNETN